MFDLEIDNALKASVNAVLQHLNGIERLPDTGILAGSSIASLLWASYIGKPFDEIITNDIDIFYLTAIHKDLDINTLKPYESWNIISTKKEACTKSDNDKSYIRHYIERNLQRYMKIEKAVREGMLNKVEYSANTSSPTLLISSFDINSTMVAYDLAENKLYYNEHFLDFLKTSKLKIVNFHTPYQTLIRVNEKCLQLGLEYSIRDDVEIFSIFGLNQVKNARTRFGIKYRNAYYKHEKELGKYFDIKHVGKSTNNNTPIWTMVMKNGLAKKGISANTRYLRDISDINFYAKYIRKTPAFLNIWSIVADIWVQQGTKFVDGMTIEEVGSSRTYKAVKFLESFLSYNGVLNLIFGKTPLKQIIQICEWFQTELDSYSHLLLNVITEGDFSDIKLKEEFVYYVSVLLIANRGVLASYKESIVNLHNDESVF